MELTFLDGQVKSFEKGSTPEMIASSLSSSLKKQAVAATVNGKLYDLNQPIETPGAFRLILSKDIEAFAILNHSTAHLLAQAVKSLYPEAMFGVGPNTDEGFYYDIALETSLTESDLKTIEKKMSQLSKENHEMIREVKTKEEALSFFKNDPYKTVLIHAIKDDEPITFYRQGDFIDLCRGGHLGYTSKIKHFKLLSLAGAYFRGDSNGPMMQRIYGTSWFSKEDLEAYLALLEERKERDHRKLGKELKIFMLNSEVGQGLATWLPNGYTVRKVLEDYVYELERKSGYLHVSTPVLGSKSLYETSGHWDHYQDNMFPPMEKDGETFVLRPMSCPHHMKIFQSDLRSYRDLPLRYAEIVTQHRYEASGSLTGLERVRAMTLTDAHIFVREDQIKEEVIAAYRLIEKAIEDLGLEIDYIEFATKDDSKDKFHDNQKLWDLAEKILEEVLVDRNITYKKMPGEAAFYGPKIDIQVKTALGHVITMSTVQLDFLLPERFDLSFINQDGEKERPVVIHRGFISTFERLMSILLEQYKGAFPTWLAPTQIILIPVNLDAHEAYLKTIHNEFMEQGFRVKMDLRNEKLGYKIREAQTQKIPYQLVIGDEEVSEDILTIRKYGEKEPFKETKEAFVKRLLEDIAKKSRDLKK
jgi:threonyl-tRNA synthetase